MITSNWFRRRRKALNLTIRAIANRLGVTETTVSNWEAGVSAPEPSKAREIAKAYEAELDEVAIAIVRLAVAIAQRRASKAASAA